MIVVRTARLLECFEFDQSEFIRLLDAAEASTNRNLIETSVPKYIVLGLNRDIFKDLTNSAEISRMGDKSVKKNLRTTALNSMKRDNPSEKDFDQIKLISNGAYG